MRVLLLLMVVVAWPAAAEVGADLSSGSSASSTAHGRLVNPARGAAFDCGDLFYDDGGAENSIFFGGGQAGETDHFLGVRFELDDFGLEAGRVVLTGFCISNSLDLTAFGGP